MSEIVARIVPPPPIGSATQNGMFALMREMYDAVDEATFASDLAEKDYVILLDLDEEIVGFTTVAVRAAELAGQHIRYIFSGDTAVRPEYWGPGHLFPSFFRLAGAVKAAEPDTPLYWFLIVKGHRTYRVMTSFFRSYVPRPSGAEDPHLLRIRDLLSTQKFGDYYDPLTGLIDFGDSKGHLAAPLQDAAQLAEANKVVRDFLKLNPDHGRGVELACIGELCDENLRSFVRLRFLEGASEGIATPSPIVGNGTGDAGLIERV